MWPDDAVPEFQPVMAGLYQALDGLGAICLDACALHLGEPAETFRDMVSDSDTIVRVIYYPPTVDAPPGSSKVRFSLRCGLLMGR